ncbi:hypothetical protein QF011_003454 [Curtobacterium flaccumfaciens]|nr:hypothetical protein [Curtobacterium flaccumfaciens]
MMRMNNRKLAVNVRILAATLSIGFFALLSACSSGPAPVAASRVTENAQVDYVISAEPSFRSENPMFVRPVRGSVDAYVKVHASGHARLSFSNFVVLDGRYQHAVVTQVKKTTTTRIVHVRLSGVSAHDGLMSIYFIYPREYGLPGMPIVSIPVRLSDRFNIENCTPRDGPAAVVAILVDTRTPDRTSCVLYRNEAFSRRSLLETPADRFVNVVPVNKNLSSTYASDLSGNVYAWR